MRIGLDLGYNAVKAAAVIDGKTVYVVFPSVIGTADTASFSVNPNGSPIVVEYEDTQYFYGEDAVALSRIESRREDREWVESPEYRVLAQAALIEIVSQRKADVFSITTGLPVRYFKEDKPDVIVALKGIERLQWSVGSKHASFPVKIDEVLVVPQPFGSLLSEAIGPDGELDGERGAELLSNPVGVIDIGGHTTNILVANRGTEIARRSASVAVGGWDMVRSIQPVISRMCPQLELRDHDVASAIALGYVRYFGEKVALTSNIAATAHQLCQSIVGQASQLWGSGSDLAAIIISGGGAHLIGDQLKQHFSDHKNVLTTRDPQIANADGYLRYSLYRASHQ